jgi:heme-degrading monooxygenase HmoA
MIVEIADIRVKPQDREAFTEAIHRAADTVLSKADGYRRHHILSGIESPGRVFLYVEWDSVQAHVDGFRLSPAFAQWRAIIGPYFIEPPGVEHFDLATRLPSVPLLP